MAIVTVYEHDSVPVLPVAAPGPARRITPLQADRLSVLEATLPAGTLSVGRKAVRFGSYCGLFRCAGDVYEVLPKVHRRGEGGNRSLLIEMLAGCAGLPVLEQRDAALALQRHTLLDFFIGHFFELLARQLRQGVVRRYVEVQENLSRVRGRIVWREQLAHNLFHQERSYCEFDELSVDNPHNRVIKATLRCLRRWVRSRGDLQRRATHLLAQFDGVSDVPVTAREARALPLDRLVVRYQPVLRWCEWFLQGESPDLRAGGEETAALLFDMNRLFQDYVFLRLQRLCRGLGLKRLRVTAEKPVRTLLRHTDAGEHGVFRMRPDIVVQARGATSPLAIIDTKWKLLQGRDEDAKWGISQADAYQMFAYARIYGCRHIVLAYPLHDSVRGLRLPTLQYQDAADSTVQLSIAALDLDGRPGELGVFVDEQLRSLLRRVELLPE